MPEKVTHGEVQSQITELAKRVSTLERTREVSLVIRKLEEAALWLYAAELRQKAPADA